MQKLKMGDWDFPTISNFIKFIGLFGSIEEAHSVINQ